MSLPFANFPQFKSSQNGSIPAEVRQSQPRSGNQATIYPEEVHRLLADSNLNEEQRQAINLNARMMSSFLNQALGGGYAYNLDGAPNWSRKKRTSSEKAKFSAIINRDPSAVRNDINVSGGRNVMFYINPQYAPRIAIVKCGTLCLGYSMHPM